MTAAKQVTGEQQVRSFVAQGPYFACKRESVRVR